MSKTFKSALSTDKELRITGGPERVCFAQRAHKGMESLVFIDNTEAPALALAILEAAGFDGDENMFTGLAVANLRDHVEEQERATSEAKEQAKLEAEALKLFQAWRKSHHLPMVEDWDMTPSFKPEWLAVARRAREINKEDNNA